MISPGGALLLGWSVAVTATSIWATRPRRRRPTGPRRDAPARTSLVVRPCSGDEPHLDLALASTVNDAAGGSVRVRLAIATEDDGARPAAERACEVGRRGGLDVRLVVTGAAGPNRKVDQVARVVAGEPGVDAVVIIDSDVVLTGGEVRALLAALEEPGVGAAWLPPVEVSPATTADLASAAVLDTSLHAFPLLSRLDPRGLVGKLVAVRSDALDAIGGLAPLVDYLGEDMELARRLQREGWESRALDGCARSAASGRSAREVLDRYTRWITVIRAQRPWLLASYPLVISATPVLALASVVAAFVDGPLLLGGAAAVLAARSAVAVAARRRSGRPWTPGRLARDALMADLLLLAAFARAVAHRSVLWRGRRLVITRGGRLAEAS